MVELELTRWVVIVPLLKGRFLRSSQLTCLREGFVLVCVVMLIFGFLPVVLDS